MRKSGILMHISSLQNNFGIGTMGKEAYGFIDFLDDSGQSVWQILPLGHTSYGDSPYQCFSAFAGNPNFISLEILIEENLLEEEEVLNVNFGENSERVDYGIIFLKREGILRKAYNRFLNKEDNEEFEKFKVENKFWLEDYSLYMAVKKTFDLACWQEWDEEIRRRDELALKEYKEKLKIDIEYYNFIQFKFFEQWYKLKAYANEKGIEILGDLPIYVAEDSADMWSNPKNFKVSKDLKPIVVAGCPPDAFSETGQLWGNPIYNWENIKKENYDWWILRIKESLKMYDIIRIDHFRGFESYYEIPYKDKTAMNGKWVKGPGMELFKAIKNSLGEVNIIAEDLGTLTEDVAELLKETKFPGMKVLQFAFSGNENPYLPYKYEKNSVAYTGTHDNSTINEWFEEWDKNEIEKSCEYLNIKKGDTYGFIKGIWQSNSDLVIGTMQDFLEIGKEGRMNLPSTLGENWKWRIKKGALTKELSEKIYKLTKLYGRVKK